jgi:hypothetical protein
MPLPIVFMRILTNARDAKEKMRSSTKSFRDTTDPIEEASQPNRCHGPVKRVPGWMATIRNHFASKPCLYKEVPVKRGFQ